MTEALNHYLGEILDLTFLMEKYVVSLENNALLPGLGVEFS